MEISNQEVAEGAARSEEAGSALTQILGAVKAVASEVEGITVTSDQMTASMQEVVVSLQRVHAELTDSGHAVREMGSRTETIATVITEVAAVSQETAAGAEEMSAAAEEVSANTQNVSHRLQEQRSGMDQVRQMAGELRSMAARLQELLGNFDLDTGRHRVAVTVDAAGRNQAPRGLNSDFCDCLNRDQDVLVTVQTIIVQTLRMRLRGYSQRGHQVLVIGVLRIDLCSVELSGRLRLDQRVVQNAQCVDLEAYSQRWG